MPVEREILPKAQREILHRGLDDYISLWEMATVVAGQTSNSEASLIRTTTLAIASDLLHNGLARPGMPTREGGFDSSTEDAEETLRRIESEWDDLGRAPDVGESSIWFDLTSEGEKRALSKS